jgi:hypothetical protein
MWAWARTRIQAIAARRERNRVWPRRDRVFLMSRECGARGVGVGVVGFHLLSSRPPLDADMAEGKGTEACSNRVKDTEGLIYRAPDEKKHLVMLSLCLRGGEATTMACPRDILQGVCEAHKLALNKLREEIKDA